MKAQTPIESLKQITEEIERRAEELQELSRQQEGLEAQIADALQQEIFPLIDWVFYRENGFWAARNDLQCSMLKMNASSVYACTMRTEDDTGPASLAVLLVLLRANGLIQ
jgi:hypothetical protein